MKIYVSGYNKDNAPFQNYLGQRVNFINAADITEDLKEKEIYNGFKDKPSPPTPLSYWDAAATDAACLLNYVKGVEG